MSKGIQDLPPELRLIIFEYFLDSELKEKTIKQSRSLNNRPYSSLAPRKFHITGRTPGRLTASKALAKLLTPVCVDKTFYCEHAPMLAVKLSRMMRSWPFYLAYNLKELRSLCLFARTHKVQLPQRTRLFCRQAIDTEQGQVGATLDRLRDIGMLPQGKMEELQKEHDLSPYQTVQLMFEPVKGKERASVCLNMLHVLSGKASELQLVGGILGLDWDTAGGERELWTLAPLHLTEHKTFYGTETM